MGPAPIKPSVGGSASKLKKLPLVKCGVSISPGAGGTASLDADRARLAELRDAARRECKQCEREGAAGCLRRARQSARAAPPHFCWSLRQDTRSWSEHFFKRMALRFDAVADLADRGAAAAAAAAPSSVVRRRAQAADAGLRTGNVRWWRCPTTRTVYPGCASLTSTRPYSAWNCLCSWLASPRGEYDQ